MAEIRVRKKSSPWPWIAGLLVVALVIGALFVLFDRDNDTSNNTPATVAAPAMAMVAPTTTHPLNAPAMAATAAPVTAATAGAALVALDSIFDHPTDYIGRQVDVSGTVREAGVPVDRGFWIENGDKRLFAVIAPAARPVRAVDLGTGQKVRLNGTVQNHPADAASEGGIDPQARRIVDRQPVFLRVAADDIVVLGRQARSPR